MLYTIGMETFENEKYRKCGANLYEKDSVYYRLFAKSISPNGCWLIGAKFIELVDIDAATGKDVYGNKRIAFEPCGTIPSHNEFITL